MSNNTNSQSTTFWKFLTKNTVEIPIIQRDYAQGRLGEENLRKNFLADLKNALDSGGAMKLDFVYGSIENGNLNPLDGQQRLTTLWLLHWYIALRAGELSEDNCKIFRKFTYETRISSREFCQNLCNSQKFENFHGNDIAGFIIKQTWFYSAWKQDPTIQSMLRMLGGTKKADKKGGDIDGIEEIFQGTSEDNFKVYWGNLTQKETIVFYHLPLKDFGLSDDLYIKMNARGKQLTSFENFKADLIGYITNQAEDEPVRAEWKKLLDPESGIPIMLDTEWTDIFWKNRSNDNRIDEIYFAFINRYFLQELICAKKNQTDLYSADNLEKENGVFRHLYGEKGDDSQLQYSGLDKYLFNDGKAIPFYFFTSLRKTLNNLKPNLSGCKFFGDCCINTYFPTWVDSKFEFIPKYDETSNITTLGQKERVVFLAVCRYFEKGAFDSISFKRWMRVVWNIVENSGIETIPAMIGAMRLIDELAKHSHDIYNFLSNPQLQVESNFAQEQIAEEIAKAKQIILNKKDNNCGFSEDDILYAEKQPLLKGCISVLFENDNCETISFGQSLQERTNLLEDLWKQNDYSLVKVLISQYDKEKPDGKIPLIRTEENWKILVTKKLKDCFRRNKDNSIVDCTGWKKMLSCSELIKNSRDYNSNKSLGIYEDKVVLWGTKGCVWNAYGNVILDDLHNNSWLAYLINNKIVESKQKVENCDFFWGWDIWFKYQDKFFTNDMEKNTVCLMNDNWEGKKLKNQENPDTQENHFYFPVDENETEQSFLHKLDCLIAQAFPDTDKSVCEECNKEKICESSSEQ